MGEKEDVFEKVQNNSMRAFDVPLMLKKLRQDARSGSIELTPEDLEWFEVYEFTLQQLDLRRGNAPPTVHSGDWRDSVKDFTKLKAVIDEMEQKGVISNVNWNVAGLALFTIPNQTSYRRHICCLISAHLNRLYRNQ
ncbi:hypothetical protein V7O62_10155 [Methanolobus sp. ZRKC2]|uniref:hypothetical protein n=1 Tax=Methanolobus sp. ZRKC2 TaxID=3125783 RepID=UPI0032527B03